MKEYCSREPEVVRALKEDAWNEGLRRHTEDCTVCSTTAGIMPMMKQLATDTLRVSRALPSYQLLWIRAQFVRRQEKLSLLDLVAFIGALVIGLTGLLGVLIWKVPGVFQSVFGFKGPQPSAWTDLIPVGLPMLIVVGGLLLYLALSDVFVAER
ncbi:MAG: hypothetical protein HY033_06550 [Ignavibacteriae bacterium]|nr:hypothetical protein [Ignavibacteria bacterium]MBI3364551.1 hypothetical protein [Ignavibacteriota bacterium]